MSLFHPKPDIIEKQDKFHPKEPPKPEVPTDLQTVDRLLEKVGLREGIVTRTIIEQLFAENLPDALSLADKFRNEPYVQTVSDERAELSYLIRRRAQLMEQRSKLVPAVKP